MFYRLKNALIHLTPGPLLFPAHYRQVRCSMQKNLADLHRLKLIQQSTSRQQWVLISKVEHFGDIVAVEPLARFLRRKHPNAFLVWCVKEEYRELLLDHPALDLVLTVVCLSEASAVAGSGLFDYVYDLHENLRFCPRCLSLISKSPAAVTMQNYLHFDNLLAAACITANLPILNDSPVIQIPSAARSRVAQLDLPPQYIVLHCSSRERVKSWPPSSWQKLAYRLHGHNLPPVVEIGQRSALTSRHTPTHNLCNKLSIMETAAVIEKSLLFLGVDSGPAHLANALHIPGIILIGKYRGFRRYIPYSGFYRHGGARIIFSDSSLAQITVEAVEEVVLASFAEIGRQCKLTDGAQH